MFYYLNKSVAAQLVLITLLLAWAVFTILTGVGVCAPEGQSLLFQTVAGFWAQHPIHLKVSAVLMLLLESLLIGRYYAANKFADSRTFMPVVFFLLFANLGGFLSTVTPAYFTMIILTMVLMVNAQDESERTVQNRVFISGILVGLDSLVDPVSISAVLFLTLVLVTHRYSKSKEIAILLFGVLFVFAYLFGTAFLFGKVPMLIASFRQLSFFRLFRDIGALSVRDYVLILYSAVLLSYLVVRLKLFYDNRLIVLRKRLVTIHILMFVLAVMLLMSGLALPEALVYVALPFSLYFSMITLQKSRIIFHEILIVAYYVLLWL